jgi:hypothetical protein
MGSLLVPGLIQTVVLWLILIQPDSFNKDNLSLCTWTSGDKGGLIYASTFATVGFLASRSSLKGCCGFGQRGCHGLSSINHYTMLLIDVSE